MPRKTTRKQKSGTQSESEAVSQVVSESAQSTVAVQEQEQPVRRRRRAVEQSQPSESTQPPVQPPAQPVRGRRRQAKESEETKVVEPQQEPTNDEDTSTARRARAVPTRDSVLAELDETIARNETEIDNLRDSTAKSKGVKYLRSLNKSLKSIRSHAARVMKQRQKTSRRTNTNSGFLKPVKISQELARFTGWDADEHKSRIDVTKFICDYIKDKKLQQPDDKRNILVDKDPRLKKLLNYDPSKEEGKQLNYCLLQRYLKSHYEQAE